MSSSKDRARGRWPHERTGIIDWLVLETSSERYIDNLLVELCQRLNETGIPIARSVLTFKTNYPEWLGARIMWRRGLTGADITPISYEISSSPDYAGSPVHRIESGEDFIRQRLGSVLGEVHPIFVEMSADGLTDYVAWPMLQTLGRRNVVTFATDAAGGFDERQVKALRDIVPLLSMISDVRMKNHLARTFLETYVGKQASAEILAGKTTRGSGSTVEAAVMICDLRDFTSISDSLPRDEVLKLLDDYFDAVTAPIEMHGGEILKFMGDGLLAIFPLARPAAAHDLLQAVIEAERGLEKLNSRFMSLGRPPLTWGVGVHVGDVMYGNIGSKGRLDFTVIGPAVNVAARLEELSKKVGHSVLFSADFVKLMGSEPFEALGRFPLRGLMKELEVFVRYVAPGISS